MDNGGRLVACIRPDMPHARRPRGNPAPARHAWQLHLVHDTHSSRPTAAGPQPRARRLAGPGAAGAVCAQRQRLACLRQRSRQELETVLQQHAQELRTAQDGIVQAAQQAAQQTDTGLPQPGAPAPGRGHHRRRPEAGGLELALRGAVPLPGRPDAGGPPHCRPAAPQRPPGPAGPGPVEEAIERRLAHLRSGNPTCTKAPKKTAPCWRSAATRCPKAAS